MFSFYLRDTDTKPTTTEYDMWKSFLFEMDDHGNPDGWPLWSQLWVIGSWWRIRDLPNVKLVHYNNLKQDLKGNMREIAAFLDIDIVENVFDDLVQNCTFSNMKNKQDPLGAYGDMFNRDPAAFFYKGETKRWQNVLTDKDTEDYRNVARRYMDDEAIYWLENGEFQ